MGAKSRTILVGNAMGDDIVDTRTTCLWETRITKRGRICVMGEDKIVDTGIYLVCRRPNLS